MDGFFILIFIGFVFFSLIKSSKKAASSETYSKSSYSKKHKGNLAQGGQDIPEVLKAKWAKQEQQNRQTKMNQAQNRAKASHTVWKTAKSASENIQRQSHKAQSRNKAQSDAFAQNGQGQPLDKNPHRRNDWGKQGHFNAGWTQPFLISIISAAALAGLFVVT